MKLIEFIDHIKHRSLNIKIENDDIYGDFCTYFEGTIGEYQTAIIRSKLDNALIERIEPTAQSLRIFVRRNK